MQIGRQCTKCALFKEWNEFTAQQRGFNGKSSQCKECHRKRARAWMFKNPSRYLTYEEIRSTWRKKTPVCAYCKHSQGLLTETRIDNIKGLYHSECITQKYESLGLVSPQRKQQLLELQSH